MAPDRNFNLNGLSDKFGDVSSFQTQEGIEEDHQDEVITGWSVPPAEEDAARPFPEEQRSENSVATSRVKRDKTEERRRNPRRQQNKSTNSVAAPPAPRNKTKERRRNPRAQRQQRQSENSVAASPAPSMNTEERRRSPRARQQVKSQSQIRNDALPADTFIDYDGTIVDLEKYMAEAEWNVEKILQKRTRNKKVQYLCQWENTWETKRMAQALGYYKVHGYSHKVIDKREMMNRGRWTKCYLCRWEPGWCAEEDVGYPLKLAFQKEQAEKSKKRRAEREAAKAKKAARLR